MPCLLTAQVPNNRQIVTAYWIRFSGTLKITGTWLFSTHSKSELARSLKVLYFHPITILNSLF